MSDEADRAVASGERDASDNDDTDAVRYEVRDTGVAIITLNRPERMNGWGGAIARGFYAGFDRAEADPDVRVVVLTGAGKAFCAGADMGMMSTVGASLEKANKASV